MMGRIRRSLAAGCVVLCMVTSNVYAAGSSAKPQSGHTLVIVTDTETRDLSSIDPLNEDITLPRTMIFNTLVTRNNTGKIEPSLATSVRYIGKNTWRIKLRSGIAFQNGDPLNAQSVKATFNRIMHPLPGDETAFSSVFSNLKTVTVVNSTTVDMVTAQPDYILPEYLVDVPILSAKQVNSGKAYQTKLNGTGPYELSSWKPGQDVVLKPNPHYWGATPRFQKITIEYVPNESTRIADLLSGRADIAEDISRNSIQQIKSHAGYHVASGAGVEVTYLTYDFKPPFNNKLVREAIYDAIDRKTLTSDLYGQYATPATSPVVPGSAGYVDANPLTDFNLTKAKQLMAQSGVKTPLSLNLNVSQDNLEAAEVIQSELKPIGINAQIKVVNTSQLFDPTTYQNNTAGSMILFTGLNDPQRDIYRILEPMFASNSFLDQFGYQPLQGIDGLIQKYVSSPNDKERQSVSKQILSVTKEDASITWLFQPDNIYGVSNTIHWTPGNSGGIDISQITTG